MLFNIEHFGTLHYVENIEVSSISPHTKKNIHTHTYTHTKMKKTFPVICDTWPVRLAKTQGFCRVRDGLTQVWLQWNKSFSLRALVVLLCNWKLCPKLKSQNGPHIRENLISSSDLSCECNVDILQREKKLLSHSCAHFGPLTISSIIHRFHSDVCFRMCSVQLL